MRVPLLGRGALEFGRQAVAMAVAPLTGDAVCVSAPLQRRGARECTVRRETLYWIGSWLRLTCLRRMRVKINAERVLCKYTTVVSMYYY